MKTITKYLRDQERIAREEAEAKANEALEKRKLAMKNWAQMLAQEMTMHAEGVVFLKDFTQVDVREDAVVYGSWENGQCAVSFKPDLLSRVWGATVQIMVPWERWSSFDLCTGLVKEQMSLSDDWDYLLKTISEAYDKADREAKSACRASVQKWAREHLPQVLTLQQINETVDGLELTSEAQEELERHLNPLRERLMGEEVRQERESEKEAQAQDIEKLLSEIQAASFSQGETYELRYALGTRVHSGYLEQPCPESNGWWFIIDGLTRDGEPYGHHEQLECPYTIVRRYVTEPLASPWKYTVQIMGKTYWVGQSIGRQQASGLYQRGEETRPF